MMGTCPPRNGHLPPLYCAPAPPIMGTYPTAPVCPRPAVQYAAHARSAYAATQGPADIARHVKGRHSIQQTRVQNMCKLAMWDLTDIAAHVIVC